MDKKLKFLATLVSSLDILTELPEIQKVYQKGTCMETNQAELVCEMIIHPRKNSYGLVMIPIKVGASS